ncbi:TetR/AcrR family transcriptional regulator [Subtercola lobariae]|uniref:TetR family transcriptional regulator n=1 Tax=Subtercola lobariae TaxID=1588641 RepID=A0A917B4A5_9MICO|nr:TetR/AcrR family transcriptional regulator [Subtercola lobariae]GGF22745.1 TetR family transcriptional regulator [Subtercola lobariae]
MPPANQTRTDPRPARSREALINAAIALVDARGADEISVTDLAAAAGVTRMTFYQHFTDRNALLQAAGIARFEGALDQFRAADGSSFEAALISLFLHMAENRTFYQRLNEGRSGLQVYLAIQNYIAEQIASSTLFAGAPLSALQKVFLGGGAMAYTTDWLDSDSLGSDSLGSDSLLLEPAARQAAAELTALIAGYRAAT